MRHLKSGRKLGKTTSHRKALLRNMVTSLLEHERIKTTDAKAKELRRVADRMITLGKRGDLHARRRALAYIRSKDVVAKLFNELAERFRDRQGGYTRVVKVGHRVGDAAPMSIIELVKEEVKEKPKKRARKKAAKKAKEPKAKKKAEEKEPEVEAEVEAEAKEPEIEAEAEEPEADEPEPKKEKKKAAAKKPKVEKEKKAPKKPKAAKAKKADAKEPPQEPEEETAEEPEE
jgi:large subunit ribosomal protein L17